MPRVSVGIERAFEILESAVRGIMIEMTMIMNTSADVMRLTILMKAEAAQGSLKNDIDDAAARATITEYARALIKSTDALTRACIQCGVDPYELMRELRSEALAELGIQEEAEPEQP